MCACVYVYIYIYREGEKVIQRERGKTEIKRRREEGKERKTDKRRQIQSETKR